MCTVQFCSAAFQSISSIINFLLYVFWDYYMVIDANCLFRDTKYLCKAFVVRNVESLRGLRLVRIVGIVFLYGPFRCVLGHKMNWSWASQRFSNASGFHCIFVQEVIYLESFQCVNERENDILVSFLSTLEAFFHLLRSFYIVV